MIEFRVETEPVAQPRPRFSRKTGRVFRQDGHPVHSYRAFVTMRCRQAMAAAGRSTEPLSGPVGVVLVFVFERRRDHIWKRKPMPRIPHGVTPDVDNLIKSTLDGISEAEAWKDDGQVCSIYAESWYAAGDERPHAEILLCENPLLRVTMEPRPIDATLF